MGKRAKCPRGFELVGRSREVPAKTPRGGVAVYKNLKCSIIVDCIYDGLRDCVVCQVRDTSVIIAAVYIPPHNSVYFDESYFMNLELIQRKFKDSLIVITGDLNCRIGTPNFNSRTYEENPDQTINSNGGKLLQWLSDKNFTVMNGLTRNGRSYDSKYTCYRGKYRSQNDLLITNNVDMITKFLIMKKEIYSDHCPTKTTIKIRMECSMNFIMQCAANVFKYDHWDINKRKLTSLKMERIDWGKARAELETCAESISVEIEKGISNEELNTLLSRSIYDICKKNKQPTKEYSVRNEHPGCNSRNFKAIAQMNLYTFEHHQREKSPPEVCDMYLSRWIEYEQLAKDSEAKELATKKNTAWKNVKADGKKMWERIDWRGKAEAKREILIRDQDVDSYFRKIFQSDKTKGHPRIDDVAERLQTYEMYIPVLDDPINNDEVNRALKKIGSGCGLDGISSDVVRVLPVKMHEHISTLLKSVFEGDYPDTWRKQILNALPKDGHTSETPKLRGTSIAPILARLYDIILTERFHSWYTPNREQAGFRTLQGCLLQLFLVNLLINYAHENNLNLMILFMDYEKAFDYANRGELITKLMDKGCGARFTKSVAKMYASTSYVPYVNNKMGDEIETAYGVAQGRNSSPGLYSFYVSDMPKCTDAIVTNDFMDPKIIAQLVDDTALLAEQLDSFKEKTKCLLGYSSSNFQVPNIPKTVYCNFAANPLTDPIDIDENTSISSVEPKKGHRYLGMKYIPTIIFTDIIKFNLRDRKGIVCKFYAWLEDNDDTPIEIKLLVLDCCLFLSMLYAVETWGDISGIEKELRMIEQKALRAILQVKAGTSIDLIYNELQRADIISKIKDLQFNFYRKVKSLAEEDAMVVSVLNLCHNTGIVRYYENLHGRNKEDNIAERRNRIASSDASMMIYYRDLVDIINKPIIYSSYMSDAHRKTITRWRLSNHKLKIELGRYNNTLREDRKCTRCNLLEDEYHALFVCPDFHHLRVKHIDILTKYTSVRTMLNPEVEDMYEVACLLSEIDDVLSRR